MTDKIFDDFMRDKLRNHSSQVPAGLWEKIEKEKRRRPVGFFWGNRIFTMGLLFAIVASIGGLIWWQSSSNIQQSGFIAAKEKGNAIIKQQEINKQTATSNRQDNQTTITVDATVDKNGSNPEVANTPITENQSLNKVDGLAKKSAVKKNNSSIEKTNKYDANIQQNSTADQLLLAANNKHFNKKTSTINSTVYGQENSIASNTASGFGENERAVHYFSNSSSNRSKGLLAAIDSKSLYSFTNKSLPSINACMPSIVDCPSANGNARNDWFVEMYASPDYTFKTVKGGTASSAYLQKKDSSESMRIGYTAGIRITKNIGEHLILKAGLQLSQINERFTLRTENERKTTTVTTTRDITDASGNITTVTETSTYTQIGYMERVSNNQYRSIELPIMLGYEFGNERLKASINGGVIANLASWYRGKTLDTAYQSISISKPADGNIYNHSVGIGLYGSISIIKPITEKLDIFAEPYFRYSLSKLTSSSLGFTQSFRTTGISLGIRYKFNNQRQRY